MFEFLGIIAVSNLFAPLKALNLPSLRRLRITSVYRGGGGLDTMEWRKFYHHGSTLGRGEDGFTKINPVLKEVPPMLVISGKNGWDHPWSIAIDLSEGTVGSIDWGDMTHYQYGGSGEIGLVIFGIPGLILTSPLWLATNLLRGAIRLLTPFDVDHWEVWLKLWPQFKDWNIDPKIVWRALRLHQAGAENSHNLKRHAEYETEIRQERIDRLFENRKEDICEGPFMVRFAAGCAESQEIMQDMADWHHRVGADQYVKLHEWLGMTDVEFEDWSAGRKTVFQLLEDREHVQVPTNPPHQG